MTLSELEDKLGYQFVDRHHLEQALTHRSWAYEHGLIHQDNQRLEFLGDAILDFVIGAELFRRYPESQEGELSRLRSRLVCEAALCMLARVLDLESHIRMGKGEVSMSGMCRPGTLADAYEAIIGAIYLDGGTEAARSFILRQHEQYLLEPDGSWLPVDAKTRLQEVAQASHLELRYEVVGETGPCHSPTFEVEVYVGERCIGKGTGHNKRMAQQVAAADALEHWTES